MRWFASQRIATELTIVLVLAIALILVSVFKFRSPHVRWWMMWSLGLACSVFLLITFTEIPNDYQAIGSAGALVCALIACIIFVKGVVHIWKGER